MERNETLPGKQIVWYIIRTHSHLLLLSAIAISAFYKPAINLSEGGC